MIQIKDGLSAGEKGMKEATRSGRLVILLAALHRARILALGGDVAVDQLDNRHRRRVGGARPRLDRAALAASAAFVARRERVEQFAQLGLVEQTRMGEAAVGEA